MPVNTATEASPSASKARNASNSFRAVAPSTALRQCGRLMETMVTGPSRSTSTLSASVMVTLSCELSLNLAALSALDHPARHGLAVVERAGHGHVGLEIFEAGLLQCAIGRDVEGIG